MTSHKIKKYLYFSSDSNLLERRIIPSRSQQGKKYGRLTHTRTPRPGRSLHRLRCQPPTNQVEAEAVVYSHYSSCKGGQCLIDVWRDTTRSSVPACKYSLSTVI
jgi:hypothetical protein